MDSLKWGGSTKDLYKVEGKNGSGTFFINMIGYIILVFLLGDLRGHAY